MSIFVNKPGFLAARIAWEESRKRPQSERAPKATPMGILDIDQAFEKCTRVRRNYPEDVTPSGWFGSEQLQNLMT